MNGTVGIPATRGAIEAALNELIVGANDGVRITWNMNNQDSQEILFVRVPLSNNLPATELLSIDRVFAFGVSGTTVVYIYDGLTWSIKKGTFVVDWEDFNIQYIGNDFEKMTVEVVIGETQKSTE